MELCEKKSFTPLSKIMVEKYRGFTKTCNGSEKDVLNSNREFSQITHVTQLTSASSRNSIYLVIRSNVKKISVLADWKTHVWVKLLFCVNSPVKH